MTMDRKTLEKNLFDQKWRLNNLYCIKDKSGKKVKFQLNEVQEYFLDNIWYMSIILKARQLGMTTFIQIYMLDCCLFYNNKSAGVIAQNREAAEDFFKDKIKFAYDNLPEPVKAIRPATNDSARELSFSNGSVIRVGTSLRSGTYQYLHVSEFGKVCHERPDRAQEIVSGSINTVDIGQYVFIESTAEAAHGLFYDMVKDAEVRTNHTKLDFKLFFFPWFDNPRYVMDEEVVIHSNDQEYFNKLSRDHEINLTDQQKWWYVKKKETLKGRMRQEYPSYPEEAFERISEHAIYGAEFRKIHEEGRICEIPYDPALPVHTFWDLGRSKTDSTCIWFMQHKDAKFYFINFYQNTQKDVTHYVKYLQDTGYVFGTHHLPHDGGHNDFDMEDYKQKLEQRGLKNVEIVPRVQHINIGIESTREKLPFCWFDREGCHDGIIALQAYEYEYDEKKGMYTQPKHNWASHPSDSFRQFAQGFSGLRGWSDYIEGPKMSTRRDRKQRPKFGKRVFV